MNEVMDFENSQRTIVVIRFLIVWAAVYLSTPSSVAV
jgi:hypothetical protein